MHSSEPLSYLEGADLTVVLETLYGVFLQIQTSIGEKKRERVGECVVGIVFSNLSMIAITSVGGTRSPVVR